MTASTTTAVAGTNGAGPVAGAAPRRVTVVAPHTRVDVALPQLVTMAELVPQLVTLSGLHEDPAGAAGWQLSRLGAAPLDAADSVTSAGLRDGEMLYLVPRGAQLPPAVFDDVVDAVADDAEHRAGNWRPEDTVRAGVLIGAVTAGAGLAAAPAAGNRLLAAVLLGLGAAVALVAGALLGRTGGDDRTPVGGAMAAVGVAAAALAAALIVAADTAVRRFGAPELLGGAAATVFTAGAAAALIPRYARHFATLASVAVVATVAAAAATPAGGPRVAAVTAAIALSVTAALPMTALRLVRLTPAPVPADMESFRADEGPVVLDDVVARAHRAEHALDALIAGQTAVLLGCAVPLSTGGGTAGRWLAATIGAALLLRARLPRGRSQRYTLLLGGTGALGAAVVAAGAAAGWQPAAGFAAGGALATAVAFAYTARARRRQPSPYVARILDVAEFLAYAAVLPIAAAVLGAYTALRGIGG